MRKFKINTNPYNKYPIYLKSELCINPGVTYLVGCNGYGKTTLMKQIKDQLKSENIEYFTYSDKVVESHLRRGDSATFEEFATAVDLTRQSEGEGIVSRLTTYARYIGNYVYNEAKSEAWIFFDSIDSGMSIDEAEFISTEFFSTVLDNHPFNVRIYIICAINSFEFTQYDRSTCIDACTFEKVSFKNYLEYKNYIKETRNRKEKRFDDE